MMRTISKDYALKFGYLKKNSERTEWFDFGYQKLYSFHQVVWYFFGEKDRADEVEAEKQGPQKSAYADTAPGIQHEGCFYT